jgi:hypothetical protein
VAEAGVVMEVKAEMAMLVVLKEVLTGTVVTEVTVVLLVMQGTVVMVLGTMAMAAMQVGEPATGKATAAV